LNWASDNLFARGSGNSLHSGTQPVALIAGDTPAVATGLLDRRKLFWLLQATGWIGFGAVMFAWGLAYWSPLDALVNKVMLVGIGLALTACFARFYKEVATDRLPKLLIGLAIICCSFVGAAIWAELQLLLFQAYFSAVHQGHISIARTDFQFGTLIFYGFVLLCWSLLYYGIDAWENAQYERRRAERAEALAQAARLRALQAQLHPHFIFNALNIASTLIDEGHAAAAKQMLARLGEFLRLALETLDTPEITVAAEIQFLRSYLDIEHARFGARLRTRIDVIPGALRALIPTLILQPLVENSLKHGILSGERGGSISVSVTTESDVLRITVTDSGQRAVAPNAPRRGIGLANTSSRLRELYGNRATLTFTSTTECGVTTVTMPLRMLPATPTPACEAPT
jgi:two-component system, LytTR family, sensor kinase